MIRFILWLTDLLERGALWLYVQLIYGPIVTRQLNREPLFPELRREEVGNDHP